MRRARRGSRARYVAKALAVADPFKVAERLVEGEIVPSVGGGQEVSSSNRPVSATRASQAENEPMTSWPPRVR